MAKCGKEQRDRAVTVSSVFCAMASASILDVSVSASPV